MAEHLTSGHLLLEGCQLGLGKVARPHDVGIPPRTDCQAVLELKLPVCT